MLKSKHTSYILGALAVIALVALPESAFAQTPAGGVNPFSGVQAVATDSFQQVRKILYLVGGLSAQGLGVLAFFGRFSWSWFWGLMAGLAIVTLAGEVVYYILEKSGAKDLKNSGIDALLQKAP